MSAMTKPVKEVHRCFLLVSEGKVSLTCCNVDWDTSRAAAAASRRELEAAR